MTTLESNASPTWATHPQVESGGAGSADRGEAALMQQHGAPLVPLLAFALVVALSLLSLYVQVLNEQMQRAELFHQAFMTATATRTESAPERALTPARPRTLQTASR